MHMAAMRKPLPESLAKPINVSAAQPSLLRKQLGLPSDESDIKNHIASEWCRRIEALDAYLGLDTNAPNLLEQRVREIISYEYGVPANSPDWWARLSWELMTRHIPGFSVGKRGRPWDVDVVAGEGCSPMQKINRSVGQVDADLADAAVPDQDRKSVV